MATTADRLREENNEAGLELPDPPNVAGSTKYALRQAREGSPFVSPKPIAK